MVDSLATVSSPSIWSVENTLLNVSCGAASNCWAIGASGSDGNDTLFEHWNGSDWSVVPTPVSLSGSELSDVTCVKRL